MVEEKNTGELEDSKKNMKEQVNDLEKQKVGRQCK